MYQGKHSTSGSPRADRPAASRRAGGSKKPLTLFVALVLLLTLTVGGSLAWLVSDDDVTNSMVPGNVPIEIVEQKDGTIKKSITIQNTGNIDAYIRVAVVANKVDADGNIIVGTAPTLNLNTEKWQLLPDGYYYYKGIVAPKASTESLGSISFVDAEVNILAESIQVLGGITSDGSASVDAWKASFDSSTATWTKTE